MARRNDVYFNEYQKNLAAQQNVKYKKKYRKLKQIVKDTVFVSCYEVYFGSIYFEIWSE